MQMLIWKISGLIISCALDLNVWALENSSDMEMKPHDLVTLQTRILFSFFQEDVSHKERFRNLQSSRECTQLQVHEIVGVFTFKLRSRYSYRWSQVRIHRTYTERNRETLCLLVYEYISFRLSGGVLSAKSKQAPWLNRYGSNQLILPLKMSEEGD